MSGSQPDARTVRVRRGPRVGAFLLLGAVVGLVVAVVATLAFPPNGQYTTPQVLGFLALICVAAGLVLGGVAAVIADAVSRRLARTVEAHRERISVPRDADG